MSSRTDSTASPTAAGQLDPRAPEVRQLVLDRERRSALEVGDAIRAASERSDYEPIAVERAFRAKFWAAEPDRPDREPALHPTRELDHSIDL